MRSEFRVSSFEFRVPALGRVVVLLVPVIALAATDGLDPRGEPNVWRGIFGVALLIFGPLVGGILLALVQLGLYRILAALGAFPRQTIPIFPVFLLRGMIILVALVAVGLFYLKISGQAVPWETGLPPTASP